MRKKSHRTIIISIILSPPSKVPAHPNYFGNIFRQFASILLQYTVIYTDFKKFVKIHCRSFCLLHFLPSWQSVFFSLSYVCVFIEYNFSLIALMGTHLWKCFKGPRTMNVPHQCHRRHLLLRNNIPGTTVDRLCSGKFV